MYLAISSRLPLFAPITIRIVGFNVGACVFKYSKKILLYSAWVIGLLLKIADGHICLDIMSSLQIIPPDKQV